MIMTAKWKITVGRKVWYSCFKPLTPWFLRALQCYQDHYQRIDEVLPLNFQEN